MKKLEVQKTDKYKNVFIHLGQSTHKIEFFTYLNFSTPSGLLWQRSNISKSWSNVWSVVLRFWIIFNNPLTLQSITLFSFWTSILPSFWTTHLIIIWWNNSASSWILKWRFWISPRLPLPPFISISVGSPPNSFFLPSRFSTVQHSLQVPSNYRGLITRRWWKAGTIRCS